MDKWIDAKKRKPSVNDGLNDDIDDVLICFHRVCDHCLNEDKRCHIAVGYCINGKWKITEPLEDDIIPKDISNKIKVTHWMLLPSLPKDTKE